MGHITLPNLKVWAKSIFQGLPPISKVVWFLRTFTLKVSHVPHLNAISQPTFVDMIETAKDSARENCKTTELKVCELAQTPKQTAQERLRSSSSPNYESTSGSVHVAKNQPARRLDEEFTCSLNETTDDIEYESPTEKIFEKLEQQKHDVEQLSIKTTRGIWAREPFQAGAWFFKETVVFKLSYFRAQQNCSVAPCSSATICKEIKRHPAEEKYFKAR